MQSRRPVITGVGIISSIGNNRSETITSIFDGISGLAPLTLYPSPRYGHYPVGQVRADLDALTKGAVRGSRSDKMACAAMREAAEQADLPAFLPKLDPSRVAVVLGATVGGTLDSEEFLWALMRRGAMRCGRLRYHECASAAELCATQLPASGPTMTTSTACSSGGMAIAMAAEMIVAGDADVVVAGGNDSLCRLTVNGFGSLLLLDQNGCRPFDATRVGISLGEGAGVVVMESADQAGRRGVAIRARVSGWGGTCDAHHATAPDPDGAGALRAMSTALDRAGLAPEQIDYLNAHGTGTPDNDRAESKAVRALFGATIPPISSTKRFYGHALAASGAIEAGICVEIIERGVLPRNLGCETPDPELGFVPLLEERACDVTHVMTNSFGFGGNNVSLVLSKPDFDDDNATENAGPITISKRSGNECRRFAVVGRGVISPAGLTPEEVCRTCEQDAVMPGTFEIGPPLPAAQAPAYICRDFGVKTRLSAKRRRKLGRLQQMSIVAAQDALGLAGDDELPELDSDRTCVSMGSGWGCLAEASMFLEHVCDSDESLPLPMRFTNSVHNALASQVAIEFKARGLNATLTHREVSFETALWHGTRELSAGGADLGLVGAGDELSPYVLNPGLRWRWWGPESPPVRPLCNALTERQRPLMGEGAAVFALKRADDADTPLAVVSGIGAGRALMRGHRDIDAAVEARWIEGILERDGLHLADIDMILTGADGWPPLDRMYEAVVDGVRQQTGRAVLHGTYKQFCGAHHSASAFGFGLAISLVRGELKPSRVLPRPSEADAAPNAAPCRRVLTYTLVPSGAKGLTCVCA